MKIELTTVEGENFSVKVEDIADYFYDDELDTTVVIIGEDFYLFEVREYPEEILEKITRAERPES